MRIAIIFLLAMAPLRAQPVVTPNASPPETPKQRGEYTVSNAYEAGYRFHTVGGNRDVYRAAVNYGNGLRLFEGELRMHSVDGKGELFDEFWFHTSGQGNDPYQASRMRVTKNGLYRYDMRFRIVNYFNRLPSLWAGERAINTERMFQNHELTLFPDSAFEVFLGYDRNTQDGPGFTSAGLDFNAGTGFDRSNFLRYRTNILRRNNQYRAGVNARFAGIALTVSQALDNYREDPRFGDASTVGGVLQNVQPIDAFGFRDEPIHGNTPITMVALRTEKERRIGFHGRYIYSGGMRNFTLAEDITGSNPDFGVSSRRQTFVVGDARRAQGSGEGTVVLQPTDRWTITNTTAMSNNRIEGDSSLLEISDFQTQIARFGELDIRHISNLTEATFHATKDLGLFGAYRYSQRRLATQGAFQRGTADPFVLDRVEQTNTIHSGAGGFRWRPLPGMRISFDSEVGRADTPLTPVSQRRFHKETVRFRYSRSEFGLNGYFRNAINNNGASLIELEQETRSWGVSGSWTPADGKWLLTAGYSLLEINSQTGIIDFLSEDDPFAGRRNFYASNLHQVHLTGQYQVHERVKLQLGYTVTEDTGDGVALTSTEPVNPSYPAFRFDGTNVFNSFPLTYHSPSARLTVQVHKNLAWNAGWQWYGYNEQFAAGQDYRAHVGFSSFRWTF